MDRRRRVLDRVQPNGRRGVEIGPLTRPIVLRGDGDVLYADHLSTQGLRAKYAGHTLPDGFDAIEEVDLVLQDRTIADALDGRGPIDYIVAAHVFEHIADPIGWLKHCGEALREGGILCLLLPDKRFTFDHFRATTTVGEMVAAHLGDPKIAPIASVYEQAARAHVINPFTVWRGGTVELMPDPRERATGALALARHAASGSIIDVHCSVFTPWSFAAVVTEIIELDLIPFVISALEPTEKGDVEFLACLEKRSDLTAAERAAMTPRLDPLSHHDLPRAPLVARLWNAVRARCETGRS